MLELQFNASNLRGDEMVVQPYNASALASAMEVMVNGTDPHSPAPGRWVTVQIKAKPPVDGALFEAAVVVDLSSLNGSTALGVRYAWGDSPCCLNYPLYPKGDEPCLPGSCPIMAEPSKMPAMPFLAEIVEGRCRCQAPQRCDGTTPV